MIESLNARTGQPLDNDQLRCLAPSIFAEEPAGNMTARYQFMPTYKVVEGLRANGFMPYSARQSSTRIGDVMGVRHEVRFRHVDTIEHLKRTHTPGVHNFLNDEVWDELALVNSHDGSSTFEMFQAAFRLACSNGLIVSAGTAGDRLSVRHTGNIVDNVIEGATRILADTDLVREARDSMRGVVLDQDERQAFAQAALTLRYGDLVPITPAAILAPRRAGDKDPTLWNVFNVVQENMVKGGVRGHTVNTGRRMTTRGITGITQDIAVNRMLWNLAQAARNMANTLDLTAGLELVEQA